MLKKILAIAAAIAVLALLVSGANYAHDAFPATTRQTAESTDVSTYSAGSGLAVPSAKRAASNEVMYSVAAESAYAEDSYLYSSNDNGSVETVDTKIIRDISVNMTTQNYADTMTLIREQTAKAGGYVVYSSESKNSRKLRYANLTLRIPAGKLDVFMADVEDGGNVTSRSESANDVTASYMDNAARLETQNGLMERLRSLVTDAADLSDLLELESKIAETQYEIDRLKGLLNQTDHLVAYATVSLYVEEQSATAVTTKLTLGQRIARAFNAGIEDFVTLLEDGVVFLTASLPFIVLIAVVVVVVRIVWKARKKKRAEK